jgi:hypothetical protein
MTDLMKDHNMKELEFQFAYAENYALEFRADDGIARQLVYNARMYINALQTENARQAARIAELEKGREETTKLP